MLSAHLSVCQSHAGILSKWLNISPADIKSRWRHNWKSAQVAKSHLVCDPTIRKPGFGLHRQQWSLLNHYRTKQRYCGACRKKWRLTDTDLCLVAKPRRCPTLSHPVPWQNWMMAYLSYTLRIKTLFRGWPHDAHMRRRRRTTLNDPKLRFQAQAILWRWISPKWLNILHSYHSTQASKWYHFQWPWMTSNPHFKVTIILNVK